MFATRNSTDELDDKDRIAKSTLLECVEQFCLSIDRVFENEFLRPLMFTLILSMLNECFA